MAISIQRMTLFAIFDAMEGDLRTLVNTKILQFNDIESVLSEDEMFKVKDRYRKFETAGSVDPADDNMLIYYLDLLDTVHILNRNKKSLTDDLAKYISEKTATPNGWSYLQ